MNSESSNAMSGPSWRLLLSAEVWEHPCPELLPPDLTTQQLVHLSNCKSIQIPVDLTVSMHQWEPIAKNNLKLDQDQAKATFHLVSHLSRPAIAGYKPRAPHEKSQERVPLGSLLLFLWVQVSMRTFAKNYLTLPSRPRPTDDSIFRDRYALVKSSLSDLLQLCRLSSDRLYAYEFDRLCILFRPDEAAAARLIARGIEPYSLSAAFHFWGQDNMAIDVPYENLLDGLEERFSADTMPQKQEETHQPLPPSGVVQIGESVAAKVDNCSLNGTDSSYPLRSTPQVSHPPGKVIRRAPPSTPGDVHVVQVKRAREKTLFLRCEYESAVSIHLIDCRQCHVYCIAPAVSVDIVGCSDSTVFVSGASRVITVLDCRSLNVHCAANLLRVKNCIDSVFFGCLQRPALLLGANEKLQLAPLGARYCKLGEHMRFCGISSHISDNHWNKPIWCRSPPSSMDNIVASKNDIEASNNANRAPCFSISPPNSFFAFHVPADLREPTEKVSLECELPDEYSHSLVSQSQDLCAFNAKMDALKLSDVNRKEIESDISSRFREWLVQTGNMEHIRHLWALNQ